MGRQRQPWARLVWSADSGYRSGLSRCLEQPVTSSNLSTHSAGIRPLSIQLETVLCAPKPRRRATSVWPPADRQASRMSSPVFRIPQINAQTVESVNAPTVKRPAKNGRMSRTPQYPASDFWRRLEEAIGENYENFNANALADRLDMSQGTIHRWYVGTGLPELKLALRLAKQGGVNVHWLLDGVKPKYPISKDPLLRELFDTCEQLDPARRAQVLENARGQLLLQQQEDAKHEEKTGQSGNRRAGA